MTRFSNLFDRIRVKPEDDRTRDKTGPRCDHPDCVLKGEYRAPKGRHREGEYWRFCLDHVKEYNASYNYFAGMPDEDVASFQKSAMTGHRPTWTMGVNAWRKEGGPEANPWAEAEGTSKARDPFNLFRQAGFGPRVGTPEEPELERARPAIRQAERRAFGVLDLEVSAGAAEIKARYKALVKRFHPDANGCDRSTEEKFREIVQAYSFLKSSGFCS